MIDYRHRSNKKELLDAEGIPFDDIRQNMQELNFINNHLGGHQITLEGFKVLAAGNQPVSVCEVGCGGGDNLVAIYKWTLRNKIKAAFYGIDINPNCIAYAKTTSLVPGCKFIISDYREARFEVRPDIIFSSLFCHHFSNEELIRMMQWMKNNSKTGFFINDLHRNPIAYHFIKLATRIFSRSYLVKHDAPLSVLRGFKKQEWKIIMAGAGINNFTIQWKWAFRHLIIVKNQPA